MPPAESTLDTFLEPPPQPEPAPSVPVELPPTSIPELALAARVPPPEPDRPFPSIRRAILFDVENTSRAEHIERVLSHLELDWQRRATEVIAVGNWRVIGHDTARLLARHGAELVHSAPAVGVRDWSDLRIAVTAGVWLASARPGDIMEIVTDDQAFDAVGDVAASLGVTFRRLSYRGLLGLPQMERPAAEQPARRSRRGGRRRRGAPSHAQAPAIRPNGAEQSPSLAVDDEGHTAPHDEIIAVVRDLLATGREREGITIDALSNALKSRGFRRPPGSPRLITRLRRIKQLTVDRSGTIRLIDAGESAGDEPREAALPADDTAGEMDAMDAGEAPEQVGEGNPAGEGAAPPRRRRRRRGGRRRRGRGGAPAVTVAP
jgi:hypothetical protein